MMGNKAEYQIFDCTISLLCKCNHDTLPPRAFPPLFSVPLKNTPLKNVEDESFNLLANEPFDIVMSLGVGCTIVNRNCF